VSGTVRAGWVRFPSISSSSRFFLIRLARHQPFYFPQAFGEEWQKLLQRLQGVARWRQGTKHPSTEQLLPGLPPLGWYDRAA
jgi:hypothetical protein